MSTKLLHTFYGIPYTAKRKLYNLRRDPAGILTNKLKSIVGEQRYLEILHSSVVNPARRWFLNREGNRAYALEKSRMELSLLQRRILRDLNEQGIALLDLRELFPNVDLRELQEYGESLLRRPENQEQIRKIQTGFRPPNPLGLVLKYYLVRLLGSRPRFSHKDRFVELVLSDEILRVVCAYFESFVRVADMDFWCNVATPEPGAYSQNWHRDSEDKKLVKLFLWLKDVDDKTGPFYYVPGSHSLGPHWNFYRQTRLRSQYPPPGAVEKHFSQEQMKRYTGPAGTLVLCDTSGIHKGGHPREGLRLLFTALYSTNAGWDYGDSFSISGLNKERLRPAARYAAGRAGVD